MARERIHIAIPSRKFTVQDLAAAYPRLSRFVFHKCIHEWLDQEHVKLVGKTKQPNGGKGKYIYEPQRIRAERSLQVST